MNEKVYKILDANFNRLREALRVTEEYFRFVCENGGACEKLKKMRHAIVDMENEIGVSLLLDNRDTSSDCFAFETRPEEMTREDVAAVRNANLKRAQEACRVIEEYSKILPNNTASRAAKKIRFDLYDLQKEIS